MLGFYGNRDPMGLLCEYNDKMAGKKKKKIYLSYQNYPKYIFLRIHTMPNISSSNPIVPQSLWVTVTSQLSLLTVVSLVNSGYDDINGYQYTSI